MFKPEYSFISGTCQTDYTPFHLKFEEDNPNFTMVIETRFADTIVTETLLKGCELNLKQTLTSSNGNTTRMALAGSLYVDNAEQLHGTVERVDFMDDGATERCRTTYEALYTVNGLLLGAAARGD